MGSMALTTTGNIQGKLRIYIFLQIKSLSSNCSPSRYVFGKGYSSESEVRKDYDGLMRLLERTRVRLGSRLAVQYCRPGH